MAPRPARLPHPKPKTIKLKDSRHERGANGGQVIAAAKAEIDRLTHRRDEPWQGFIFETRPGASITNAALCRALDRHYQALGAKICPKWGRWSPHDLRRTMRTGLSDCQIRPDIAELTIGHVKSGIISVYDQHSFDAERQAAWKAWEVRLSRIVAGQDPDSDDKNIVRLAAHANA